MRVLGSLSETGNCALLENVQHPEFVPRSLGCAPQRGWLGGEALGSTGRGRQAGRGAPETSLSRFGRFRDCVRSGGAPHGRVRTWEQFRKFHPNASLAHSAAFFSSEAERRNQALSRGLGGQLVRGGADSDEFRGRLGPEADGELSMRPLGARTGLGEAGQRESRSGFGIEENRLTHKFLRVCSPEQALSPRPHSPDGAPPRTPARTAAGPRMPLS